MDENVGKTNFPFKLHKQKKEIQRYSGDEKVHGHEHGQLSLENSLS